MENWCNSRGEWRTGATQGVSELRTGATQGVSEWRTGATQGVNGELVQLKG